METVNVADAFPIISATEQEVCRLVLHVKTQREVADLLGKAPNNISSERNHIRKSLARPANKTCAPF